MRVHMERLRSHAGASTSASKELVSASGPCRGRRSIRHQRQEWPTLRASMHGGSPDRPAAVSTTTTEPITTTPSPVSPVPPAEATSSTDKDSIAPVLEAEESKGLGGSSPIIAALSLLGVAFLLGGGFLLKDQIKGFLEFFIAAIEDWGPWGYAAYAAVYIGLEVLALPAIPLTMTAGAIFGSTQGTALVSVAGTVAATIAFLIARYLARDKVRVYAYKHPRFAAIDRAIGRSGLKFVTLLRLSPLLPLSASNYLYGLTSVDLGSYVLGSWVGMLPGTWAYVHAGAIGRAVLMEGEGSLSIDTWQIGLGLGATLLALGFIGQLAKKAIDEVEESDVAAASPPAAAPGSGASPNSSPGSGSSSSSSSSTHSI